MGKNKWKMAKDYEQETYKKTKYKLPISIGDV